MCLLSVGGSTGIMKPVASWTQTILSRLNCAIVVEDGRFEYRRDQECVWLTRGASFRVESSNVTSARLRYGLNLHFVAALC